VSDEAVQVRRLTAAELAALDAGMPSWSSREYPRRLAFQDAGLAVQLVAWAGSEPVGRAMLVLPGHPEWSTSAHREGCAEIRDVGVDEGWQRRGIATALIRRLETEAREGGCLTIGLSVGRDEDTGAARALYERLGYRFAHGPYVIAAALERDDGTRMPVAGVVDYLVKPLSPQG
jgi:GNAT superfamily N-acetyltransferase